MRIGSVAVIYKNIALAIDNFDDLVVNIPLVNNIICYIADDIKSNRVTTFVDNRIGPVTVICYRCRISVKCYRRAFFINIRKCTIGIICQCSYRFIAPYNLLDIDHLCGAVIIQVCKLVAVIVHITTHILDQVGNFIKDVFILYDLLEPVDHIRRYIDRGRRTIFGSIGIGAILVIEQCRYRFIGPYNFLDIDHLRGAVIIQVCKPVAVVVHITTHILDQVGNFINDVFILYDLLELVDHISRYIDRGRRTIFGSIGIGAILVIDQCRYRFFRFNIFFCIDDLSIPILIDISKIITVIKHISSYIPDQVGNLINYTFILDDLLKLVDHICRYIDRGRGSVLRSIGIGTILVIDQCSYRFIGTDNVLKIDNLGCTGSIDIGPLIIDRIIDNNIIRKINSCYIPG